MEKQNEQKHIMIQWKGDNLKEVIDFTGKNINLDKCFTSFEDYEKYVHEHNDIFKLFNEDGSHYEVPVGAWIVKTPDGCNVASKAIFKQKHVEQDTETRDLWVYIREWNDKFGRLPKDEDELAACIDYVMKRQKPADKLEPKFKVGDWITNGKLLVGQVTSFDGEYYHYMCDGIEQPLHISNVDKWHLWTIQDAKDGDVLIYPDGTLIIFKKIVEEGLILSYVVQESHLLRFNSTCTTLNCYPATKEQRDNLFKKMHKAGYEWDENMKMVAMIV